MTRIRLATAVAVLGALAACRSGPLVKAETVAANVLLPPDQERALGLQVQPQIEQELKLSNDPAIISYVNAVGQRVAAASPNPDNWKFTFKVIDDPNTVNAFAIPGGTIYVFTGLLRAANDEAELSGVLAHEVAHVTSRHVARRMVNAFGLQTLASIALGGDPGLVSQIAASLALNGALLKNSRDDEAEADSKGVVATARAGYDPHALASFFQTLQKKEGKMPGVLAFFSDHPTTGDRIRSINEEIAQKGLSGGSRNPGSLQAIQNRIVPTTGAEPPPAKQQQSAPAKAR